MNANARVDLSTIMPARIAYTTVAVPGTRYLIAGTIHDYRRVPRI